MKTIAASLIALGLLTGAAQATASSDYFTNLNRTAPRSVFDDIKDSAPRSVFDDIRNSAPREAADGSSIQLDLTGE